MTTERNIRKERKGDEEGGGKKGQGKGNGEDHLNGIANQNCKDRTR